MCTVLIDEVGLHCLKPEDNLRASRFNPRSQTTMIQPDVSALAGLVAEAILYGMLQCLIRTTFTNKETTSIKGFSLFSLSEHYTSFW